MAMAPRFLLALTAILLARNSLAVTAGTNGDPPNSSSINWFTSMPSDHLQNHPHFGLENRDLEDLDTDGGFSSLDSMLQWAIGHSDPATLKGEAQAVQNLSDVELKGRRASITELMESLRFPTDTELMKSAISDLQNSSSSYDDRKHALEELLELVELINNANDLYKMGGLVVVFRELHGKEQDSRILAAWVLGKASQNNPVVQNQLLELGVIPVLLDMVRSQSTEEAVKALYALSAVIRNHPVGQEHFYSLEGASLLEDLMRDGSSDVRLRRKSLLLAADLAEQQKDSSGVLQRYEPTKSYLMAIVNMVETEDPDMQEKALMAIHNLSGFSQKAHNLLKQECNTESALQKLQLQLDASLRMDDDSEFVKDLQLLCDKVRSLFLDREEQSS